MFELSSCAGVESTDTKCISIFYVITFCFFSGKAWQRTLYHSIDGSRCLIALISESYIRSAVCQEEYNLALAKHCSGVSKRPLKVLVQIGTLYHSIDGSRCMIALISESYYIKSSVCQEEYNLALAKHCSGVSNRPLKVLVQIGTLYHFID